MKPNIIFMGTPEFAVPALEALHAEIGIMAVVTVPDKPQGRGRKLLPSPIKIAAEKLKIQVLQPESLKDPIFTEELKKLEPDIIVVIAFKILPESVYTLAKLGSFNIHASLLPQFRGAAPINWAIINGEKIIGLTSFLLKKEVDTGDILLQKVVDIPVGATAGDLHDLLMPEAAVIAVETCRLLMERNYKPMSQDNSLASPAPKIFREQCKIDWNMNAAILRNFIHGVSPFPGAWTVIDDKVIKILRAESNEHKINHTHKGVVETDKLDNLSQPGEYIMLKDSMLIRCADGYLFPIEIQLEGKGKMNIKDFINGWRGMTRGFLN